MSQANEQVRAELGRRVSALTTSLGYAARDGNFLVPQVADAATRSHLVEDAFERIGVNAIFGVSGKGERTGFQPFVYVASAASDHEAKDLHRRAWTQGVAPILLIVRASSVEIRKGLQPPPDHVEEVPFDPDGATLPDKLRAVSAERICASHFWVDFQASVAGIGVDERLIEAIRALNARVSDEFPLAAKANGLLNRLIGRMIYLCVLVDRGIVDEPWMTGKLKAAGFAKSAFPSEALNRGARSERPAWSAREMWAVMDAIDDAINGCVFNIPPKERRLVDDGMARMIHGVIRCGDKVGKAGGGLQLSFLDFAFDLLRTETISAIYQEFLRSESTTAQAKDGAFYTPPFVAEHVVDLVARESAFTPSSRVLDPACGSGVFLVTAYRRLLEGNRPKGGWSETHAASARAILVDAIHGIEKNPQAANVCRFSLYLTLLDYIGPVSISRLAELVPGEKFLPDLDANIRVASAFEDKLVEPRSFSHVVTNPPWVTSKGVKDRSTGKGGSDAGPGVVDADLAKFDETLAKSGLSIAHDRYSDRFVWLSKLRFLAGDGVLGVVLPTRSLIARQSGRFTHDLATLMTPRSIVNLAHFRYSLFAGARAPAAVVVLRNRPSMGHETVEALRPTRSSLPVGGRLKRAWTILASDGEADVCRVRDLLDGANGWFGPMMLSSADRQISDALSSLSVSRRRRLSDFLDRSGLAIKGGGDVSKTGIPEPSDVAERKALWALGRAELETVRPSYQPLFGGRVLLIPRSFRNIEYLEDPHAFRSTINAIYPASPATREGDRYVEGMRGLASFLRSGVAGYFTALFGASYTLMKDRMELRDLLRFPFPYEDIRDARLGRLAEPGVDVDESILDAMDASKMLRELVREHLSFTGAYADGGVPDDAYDRVTPDMIRHYRHQVQADLARSLGRLQPSVTIDGTDGEIVCLSVRVGKEPSPVPKPPEGYIGISSFVVEKATGNSFIYKSNVRNAFTLRQATADAAWIVRRLVA